MKSDRQAAILEFTADLLKERIYATFVLLAVLLAIDTTHVTPQRVIIVILGTAFSLWAASLTASRMSYRIVMGEIETDRALLQKRLIKHSPLLHAAVFPVLVNLAALLHVIPVQAAVNISLAGLLLLLVTWSLLSARALKVGLLGTFLLAGVELAIAVIIIVIKMATSH